MNSSILFLLFFCIIGIARAVKTEIEVEEISCSKARIELAFVIDASSSISPADFIAEKEFISDLSSSFDIGQDKSRIGLVIFAQNARIEFGFSKYNNTKDVENAIKNMVQLTGTTSLGEAIKLSGEGVLKEARSGIQKFMIVLTDGMNTKWPSPKLVTPPIKKDGAVIISVGVGNDVDPEELKGISSSNSYYNVSEFSNLKSIVEKIRKEICKVKVTYKLSTCETAGDLGFIIDPNNTNYLSNEIDLLSKVLHRLDISPNKQRVSIIVDRYGTLVPLDKFTNTDEYIKYLETAKFQYTYNGVNGLVTADKVLTESRIDAPKLAILFQTHESTNHREDLSAALFLRNKGTNLLTVGIGPNVNENNLSELSSTKKAIHPSTVNWDESYVNEMTVIFCQNLKRVYNECSGKKVDLVFVLDSSSSVGPDNWSRQSKFVTRMVSMLDVSNGTTKIGSVYFNSEAYLGFEIGKYNNKKDSIDALLNLPYSEGATAIGSALKLAQQQLKNSQRKDAVGVIILVTDGKSNIGIKPEPVATAIKNEGTHIICIGITDQISRDQLKKLSSTNDIYEITDFEALEKFPVETLTKQACQAIKNELKPCDKTARPVESKKTEL